MTTPFWCLLFVALAPYVLSTLSGALRVRQLGSLDNKYPRLQQARLTGLGARAQAAHQNALEAVPFFAAAVLVAHVAGADPSRAAQTSLVFVAARILHAVFYLGNLDLLRSLAFVVGVGACIRLFLLAG